MKQKGIWIDADNIEQAATLKELKRIITLARKRAASAHDEANRLNVEDYANIREQEYQRGCFDSLMNFAKELEAEDANTRPRR